MAHNVRVRGMGEWTDGLLPADLLALDTLQKQLLSKRGGAWAPTSPIEIGGAQGLEITGHAYLDQVIGVELTTGLRLGYDSYSVTREHLASPGTGTSFAVQQIFFNLSQGFFLGSLDVPVLVQTDADDAPTTTPRWWVPLTLPVGSVLTKLAITVSAQFSHGANEDYVDALPASMPRLALARADHDGSPNFGTPVFDPTDSIEVYRTQHDIELTTFTSPTFDGTRLWWAVIDGEYGTSARAGLYVSSIRTTVTQTVHDEFQF